MKNESKSKNKLMGDAVKIMFGASLVFTFCFAAVYIWGVNFCRDFYELLDVSLPYCFLGILSAIGFGAAYAAYEEPVAECTARRRSRAAEISTSGKRAKNENRYVIRTYDRSGVHKKRINVRGDYGLLKSA